MPGEILWAVAGDRHSAEARMKKAKADFTGEFLGGVGAVTAVI